MGNAFVLIVAGLLLMYVVISNKFYCLEGCAACLAGKLDAKASAGGSVGGTLPGSSGGSVDITRAQIGGLFGQ